MSRPASLLFAMLCYAIFFATSLYLIVFVGSLPFSQRTVDVGPQAAPAAAATIDILLIALFGLQHSIMARQGFKRWWTRIIPPPIERSIYVLLASIALMILFLAWRPIAPVIWDVSSPLLRSVIWLLFWIGWGIVLLSTFLMNHLELFGLQQAWHHVGAREAQPPELRQPFFYKWVRHPLYLGFILALWASPHMTAGHLLLAAGLSIYTLVAIRYEERDLVAMFGRDYELYRQQVGMLTPKLRRRTPRG